MRPRNTKISHRGQTSLPAELRKRWGLESGGELGVIDLGEAALIVPGGIDVARREVRRVIDESYRTGLRKIDDPDLAT